MRPTAFIAAVALIAIAFDARVQGAQAVPTASVFTYCVPTDTVDLDPFEPLGAPTRLLTLRLVTRSFLSTDPSEPGLFSRWQFDSKGRVLTADIAADALWRNGRRLTPREAGLGLAKALRTKPLGQRVRVQGSEALDSPDWMAKSIVGVRIVSAERLEITFEGDIENLSGAVREALSTNSRPNRVWPVRFDEGNGRRVVPDVIGKFSVSDLQRHSLMLDVFGSSVLVKGGCTRGDFFSYMPPEGEEALFSADAQKSTQALYAVVNPEAPELKTAGQRQALLNWIRSPLNGHEVAGFTASEAHFLKGEPGFSEHDAVKVPEATPGQGCFTVSGLPSIDWNVEKKRRLPGTQLSNIDGKKGFRSISIRTRNLPAKGAHSMDFSLSTTSNRFRLFSRA